LFAKTGLFLQYTGNKNLQKQDRQIVSDLPV